MKPTLEELKRAAPQVEEGLVREHLERLDDDYFVTFEVSEIAEHLTALSSLSPEHPSEIIVDTEAGHDAEITVLAFDYPAEFSLITGVLAAMGFGIQTGHVYTYERRRSRGSTGARRRSARRRRPGARDSLHRRRIIDHFSGHIYLDLPPQEWAEQLQGRLTEILELLEKDDPAATELAKHRVNEMVTQRLVAIRVAGQPPLYPMELSIDNESGPFTRVKIVSQDTPAFLYSLSTALALHSVSIERVRIGTENSRIEDILEFVDRAGHQVRDPNTLDKIRLSVLLTKQFTYYLNTAPNPYLALTRFEQLTEDIVALPESGKWMEALSDPHAMRDLARLLGASDYIWEDFIRLQYESLLPILGRHVEYSRTHTSRETIAQRLEKVLKGAKGFEEKKKRLNEFKNREIYLADLDHILNPDVTFRVFAERLTALAAAVVNAAAETVYRALQERFGAPRTVAGLPASYAIFGLGKMGGAALGYASDIELLFVYSDNGRTDGGEPTTNAEFFNRLAQQTARFVTAKREGIFRVDLRLRPHGRSGPHAASLEQFCSYYGPGGPAHSYERLALVRLRAIGGDSDLGQQVERLRDQFVYRSLGIVLSELRRLRAKQFKEKQVPGRYNAKFSPGALVDLEYAVQFLQVMYGESTPALRTPRIHLALEGLQQAGVLEPEEAERLQASYDFMRRLINGLRMLRGSAQDLFLPETDADEYLHLARRMGYEDAPDMNAARQLHVEFETRTAAVRAFVERHLGRESLPGPGMGNLADLILSDGMPEELRDRILRGVGFQNPRRAYVNLRSLAGEGKRREHFCTLAVLASDLLQQEPGPDMTLNNWERFMRAVENPESHFETLLAQPTRLEILLAIFSRSQFLADLLITNPQWWSWVTTPGQIQRERTQEELEAVLRRESGESPSREAWMNAVRRFRQRHTLRIGTRDMYARVDIRIVMREISVLADAILNVALERAWHDVHAEQRASVPASLADGFCLLAFGKLGGRELNYSSDIDLMGVYDEKKGHANDATIFARVLERLYTDLAKHTVEGHAYRLDLRLRPHGLSGEAVSSLGEIKSYYQSKAALWEIQSALKLRPVAGALAVGEQLLRELRPLLLTKRKPREIAHSIRRMRELAMQHKGLPADRVMDVKSDIGGIREVEFLVQGLQLMHAPPDRPGLLSGNTLEALERLAEAEIVRRQEVEQLVADYIFLRRVEHYLQILEDQQIHELPTDPVELELLAHRMLGRDASRDAFLERLRSVQQRVHALYAAHLKLPALTPTTTRQP